MKWRFTLSLRSIFLAIGLASIAVVASQAAINYFYVPVRSANWLRSRGVIVVAVQPTNPLLRIFQVPNWTGIDASGVVMEVSHWKHVQNLGALEEIEVNSAGHSVEIIDCIRMSSFRLKRLRINNATLTEGLAHAVGSCKLLRDINLNGARSAGEAFSVPRLANLSSVSLNDCSVTIKDIEWIGDQQALKELSIANCPVDDSCVEVICKHGSLKSIDVSGTSISGSGILEIIAMNSLDHISLPQVSICDLDAEQICKSTLRRIGLRSVIVEASALKRLLACDHINFIEIDSAHLLNIELPRSRSTPLQIDAYGGVLATAKEELINVSIHWFNDSGASLGWSGADRS